MSSEPPDQPAAEEGPHADLQHLDSHSFPHRQPGAYETEMAKLQGWVNGYLMRWVYEASSDRPWCLSWDKHEDAVSVLHAAFRSYTELIDTEVSGMSAPSTWIHDHLLRALAYLRHPDGPFSRCMRSTQQRDEHRLPEPVSVVPDHVPQGES